MNDPVELILKQWGQERPDLDVSPMAVIGRLARVVKRFDERLSRSFAEHGLDSASFDVLAALRRSGPPFVLSPKDLSGSSMVTTSATAQRLNKLENEGLVRRASSVVDGRKKQVQLTEKGKGIIDGALSTHLQTEHALLRNLDGAERQMLATLLAKLDVEGESDGLEKGVNSL
ncbi:MarR family transcriptional regulator [Paenarthrobacter nitroguajacolicus]|uniref:MarR family winged helix-turn-helix transcriptional regulator n=1 Tax=Paenarthrobacter nitroguajacolicus TaxID=211146 RepID=UPI0015B8E40D|nr:MarR family transcriptional regulator [Paenarthrobacter nitroguajacolicus]NWL13855.1 MarR family transcriptional regulator [Paenarthrobacter nitroguajacolicus]